MAKLSKELEKVDEQFKAFDAQVKDMTLDNMNKAPVLETEPQVKASTRELNKEDATYIKPIRSISRGGKVHFNEKYRKQHDEDWKYVKCVVENHEIIGEAVECWTAKYGCDPAHFWRVPVNKPVYIPRLLAEQLSNCKYHRLSMEETNRHVTGQDSVGTYVGAMVVDHTKHRIDARPVGFGFVSMAS